MSAFRAPTADFPTEGKPMRAIRASPNLPALSKVQFDKLNEKRFPNGSWDSGFRSRPPHQILRRPIERTPAARGLAHFEAAAAAAGLLSSFKDLLGDP